MTRKTLFFLGVLWFKFNNLGLALVMALKFYTSVAKRVKLKVRKFLGLIPTPAEVRWGKLVGDVFLLPPEWGQPIFQLQISWYRCMLRLFKISRLVHTLKLPRVLKIFWCSDLNIPSNWLYVINSHHQQHMTFCS